MGDAGGVLGIVFFVGLVVAAVLLGKAKDAASKALTQKVIYRKKYEKGKHILAGFTFETTASPSAVMQQLEKRVVAAEAPSGLTAQLYVALHRADRIDYVYGNKFSESFRVAVVLESRESGTFGVLKPVRWHENEGIIVAQEWLGELLDQVHAAVRQIDPSASFVEGVHDSIQLQIPAEQPAPASGESSEPELEQTARARVATPEPVMDTPPAGEPAPYAENVTPLVPPTKANATWQWIGIALVAGSILWLAVGVRVSLLPIWLGILAAGGIITYVADRAARAKRPPGVTPGDAAAPDEPRHEATAPAADAAAHVSRTQTPATEEFGAFSDVDLPESFPEPSPEDFDMPEGAPPMEPRGPLSSKNLARGLVVVGAVVMLLVVGSAVVGGISRAVDSAERARTDRSGPPRANAPSSDAVAPEPVDRSDEPYDPLAGALSVDALTGDFKARSEIELFNSAPTDGSRESADVVYSSGGQKMGYIFLEFALVSRDPGEWYIAVFDEGSGFYVDREEVEPSEFYAAIDSAVNGEFTRGMIVFDREAVRELHVFTQGQRASASTSEKDQVTVVPDYETLDLPYGDWESLEFQEWFEAHDAAVEAAFREAGLVAAIKWTSFESEDDETFQEPPAGSVVPVGTTVYITIYTLE